MGLNIRNIVTDLNLPDINQPASSIEHFMSNYAKFYILILKAKTQPEKQRLFAQSQSYRTLNRSVGMFDSLTTIQRSQLGSMIKTMTSESKTN